MATGMRVGTCAVLAMAGCAMGQPCQPHWEPSVGSPNSGVNALAAVNDGTGLALYAGGRFTNIGAITANRIARWDGVAWMPLGSGIPGEFNSHGYQGCCANVHAISADEGTVYIAGNYVQAGGVLIESIGSFSAGQWHSVGGGVANVGCTDCAFVVNALTRFGDPGQGPLYAAGTFDLAGGVPAAKVARWDGAGWSAVGSGISAAAGDPFPPVVQALAPFQFSLYAAGSFSVAGAIETNAIAAWNGTDWVDVGGGIGIPKGGRHPNIAAMTVFDDGSGSALYVAGVLDIAGGAHTRNIARWNGTTWSAVGGGIGTGVNDRIWTLSVFDDGTGPALYAGGEFSDAGGSPASNIARWNGRAWSAVGGGTDGPVHAMAAFDGISGPELFVGGWFLNAGGASAPYLAKWVGCSPCYANCDASTAAPVLNILDFECFLGEFAAGSPAANCDQSTTPPILNINDFMCFLNRFATGCGR